MWFPFIRVYRGKEDYWYAAESKKDDKEDEGK